MTLRLLTRNEAILAGLCAVLLVLALRPRPTPRPVVITHTDTLSAAQVAAQEPPAKPGILHRAAYREVKPTHVTVAPHAGSDILAAVCDTPRAQSVPDSLRTVGDAPSPPAAPSVPYAWKLHDGWTPWSAHHFQWDEVGRDGLRVVDVSVHTPAEGRFLPVEVTREARGWRRVLKPLPFVALTFAAGYAAGTLTR